MADSIFNTTKPQAVGSFIPRLCGFLLFQIGGTEIWQLFEETVPGRAETEREPQQQVSELLKQYDEEYIRYCIEQEQVVSALEANLHTSDDPREIAHADAENRLRILWRRLGGDS